MTLQTADDQPPNASTSDGNKPPPSGDDAPPPKRPKLAPTLTPLSFGAAEDKGHRTTLEDVWIVHANAHPADSTVRLAMCGVFDGHAGRNAATFAAEHLPQAVNPTLVAAYHPDNALDSKSARRAIVNGFAATDTALLAAAAKHGAGRLYIHAMFSCKHGMSQPHTVGWSDGATAVVAWVLHNTVLVANVGDAKAVLARCPPGATAPPKAVVLTKEHKAMHEMDRIVKAKGRVVNGRLEGRLEVSRAFGDPDFKPKGLSCTPDVSAFSILPQQDRFLLLACDGFFTVYSPQEAVHAAAALLEEGRDAKGVCVKLLHEAIVERRCKDNCTLVLCVFGDHEGGGNT